MLFKLQRENAMVDYYSKFSPAAIRGFLAPLSSFLATCLVLFNPAAGTALRPAVDWAYRATVDTPSTNLVRKSTFALLNIPSFRETTMN